MASKTLNKSAGLTFIELTLAFTIIGLLLFLSSVVINPVELKKRGRDEKRLSEISTLDRLINEYRIDNGTLPDLADTTRTTITLPAGNTGPPELVSDGWIDVNLSTYMSKLPIDPLNDSTHYFSYRHDGSAYEINAVLEYYSELSTGDGGNDNGVYEVGDDLTIL